MTEEERRRWLDPKVFPPIVDGLPTWDSKVPDWVYADEALVDQSPPWDSTAYAPRDKVDWPKVIANLLGGLMIGASIAIVVVVAIRITR